jgi:hypothetical protein
MFRSGSGVCFMVTQTASNLGFFLFSVQKCVLQCHDNAPEETRNFWLQILRTKGGT